MGRDVFRPRAAKDAERICAHTADAVVGAAHDEPGAAGNGAEFADHETVLKLRAVEKHVVSLKIQGGHGVVIVGVVPHGDIGSRNHIFNKARGFVLIGKNNAGVRNSFHKKSPSYCGLSSPPERVWSSDAIARI